MSGHRLRRPRRIRLGPPQPPGQCVVPQQPEDSAKADLLHLRRGPAHRSGSRHRRLRPWPPTLDSRLLHGPDVDQVFGDENALDEVLWALSVCQGLELTSGATFCRPYGTTKTRNFGTLASGSCAPTRGQVCPVLMRPLTKYPMGISATEFTSAETQRPGDIHLSNGPPKPNIPTTRWALCSPKRIGSAFAGVRLVFGFGERAAARIGGSG